MPLEGAPQQLRRPFMEDKMIYSETFEFDLDSNTFYKELVCILRKENNKLTKAATEFVCYIDTKKVYETSLYSYTDLEYERLWGQLHGTLHRMYFLHRQLEICRAVDAGLLPPVRMSFCGWPWDEIVWVDLRLEDCIVKIVQYCRYNDIERLFDMVRSLIDESSPNMDT